MGRKQEELEATMLIESYDQDAIPETWWDESHYWTLWETALRDKEAEQSWQIFNEVFHRA